MIQFHASRLLFSLVYIVYTHIFESNLEAGCIILSSLLIYLKAQFVWKNSMRSLSVQALFTSQWWQSNSHLSSRSILPETTFEESCVCLECKAEKFSLIPGATGKPTGIERIFFFTPSLHQSLTIILLHFLVCIQLEPWFSWPKKYVVLYHYRIYFFLLCCM